MSITPLKLDYHYGTEADAYSFYRIPKILFTDERFATISTDAKMLYGLMLDRMSLSMKNGWFDSKNRVFIYFTLDDAIELLGCGHTKIIKLLSELDTTKGIGLIERKKQGQGKPTIIYVKSFTSLPVDETQLKRPEHRHSRYPSGSALKKQNALTSENEKSENPLDDVSAACDGGFDEDLTSTNVFLPENLQPAEVKTSVFQKSRVPQIICQDFTNAETNKTKEKNTEISDTHSINLSASGTFEKSESEKPLMDKLMDRISENDLEDLVYEEILNEGTLPYWYVDDERRMLAAIRLMTEYRHFELCAKTDVRNEFEFSVIKLFTEALTEMLTTKSNMTLKGSIVTYAKVYDKLMPYIKLDDVNISIYGLLETAKSDFTMACQQSEIKNHFQYMKSCIWNAMQVGDIGIQALIKKDFGKVYFMKYSIDDLNGAYSEDDFCFFWGHQPSKDGIITESCLSQWWKCVFIENQILFCCVEQYMMYWKAILFEDFEYAQKIICSRNPKEIKEYGRLVRNFDDKKWNEEKSKIVMRGNILKFSQNTELLNFLINTKDKILAEASPYDTIWGIGMRKGADCLLEPLKWKGLNLLGFILMDVRNRLG